VPQPDWDALQTEVRDLARRVAELERYTGLDRPAPAAAAEASSASRSKTETAVLVAIVGRAFLGLAGAYLLRAITEGGALPAKAGVGAGIAYALGWLYWAGRTTPQRKLEAAIHTLTAAMVLSPLLWEATLHFHAIGTWAAAAILLLFAVFGMAAAWRRNLVVVSTIATLAGLGTAAALLIATHDVLPSTFLFLAVAETVEISACLEHWLSERWIAAAAADLSVLLATWLVTNERGLPEMYAPIPHTWLLIAQVALLAIYLSSTIVRTLLCGFTFTGFEMAQCAAAFAIAVTGGLRLSALDRRAAPAMALLILCCAAACYLVAFAKLEHGRPRGRNFYAYSTFGILLALAGSRILLPANAAPALWSLLAIACFVTGWKAASVTLEFHGAAYLLLALASLGALENAASLLLGAAVWPIHQPAALWLGAGIAALGYSLAGRTSIVLRLVLAATGLWLAAGIAAGLLTGAYHGWFGAGATHAYCATLRTALLAASSVALAWCGARWSLPELSRLMYPAMALGAYRLIAEDLYQERKVALFFSLLVYGGALMVLPKMKQAVSLKL
jgi:hypothetical protein